MKTNSIYFTKEQRKELHEFVSFVYHYNMSCKDWDNYIDMHIYNEDEGTIVEFSEKIECEGFKWIDECHTVQPIGEEYLDIEEDQTYQIPNNYSMCPGFKSIKGIDILNLKDSKNEEE